MALLVILLIGSGMASMDGEILVIAAPSLRASLGASDAELQLILAMYTIAFGALVVTGARLGDVVGRRRAFLLGLTGFTLASLAGGLAPTPTALIMARAVQGAAAAIMTPQVLSTIQLRFEGEMRARAIGAYGMVLAAGVAVGHILGGLLVGLHLLASAWRPALLLNAPIGALLLCFARRHLAEFYGQRQRRLDLAGAAVLSTALLLLVVPLTIGREGNWPDWVWPCLAGSGVAVGLFIWIERRLAVRGDDPLFDLKMLTDRGVASGVVTITLVMACYAGFLVSLTVHLQSSLRFSPVDTGLIFFAYVTGFASTSLAWPRARRAVHHMPIFGPLVMGAALVAIGIIATGGGWPVALATPVLVCAGAGQACAFSPLAERLTTLVRTEQAADLSGLIATASLIGQVLGVAAFVGFYFSDLHDGSAHALGVTTRLLAATLVVTAACARRALRDKPRVRTAAAWIRRRDVSM